MNAPPIADLAAAIRSPVVRSVYDFWMSRRSADRLPTFDDVDPAAIKAALPSLWVLRYDRAADAFAYRIAGEEINRFFRKNMSGRPVVGSMGDALAQAFEGRARRVCRDCRALHFIGKVYASSEYSAIGERLFLPLGPARNDDGGVLGITDARGHEIDARRLDEASGDLKVIRDGAYRVYDARPPAAAGPGHETPARP